MKVKCPFCKKEFEVGFSLPKFKRPAMVKSIINPTAKPFKKILRIKNPPLPIKYSDPLKRKLIGKYKERGEGE